MAAVRAWLAGSQHRSIKLELGGDVLELTGVHFSCNGVKDEAGELYFAASNTLLRRLGATAEAADFVNRRMSRGRSRRVVLLLDCCYADAFERGMTARPALGWGSRSKAGAVTGIERGR